MAICQSLQKKEMEELIVLSGSPEISESRIPSCPGILFCCPFSAVIKLTEYRFVFFPRLNNQWVTRSYHSYHLRYSSLGFIALFISIVYIIIISAR